MRNEESVLMRARASYTRGQETRGYDPRSVRFGARSQMEAALRNTFSLYGRFTLAGVGRSAASQGFLHPRIGRWPSTLVRTSRVTRGPRKGSMTRESARGRAIETCNILGQLQRAGAPIFLPD